jgi:phosphoserine phosphatase RsbU/P
MPNPDSTAVTTARISTAEDRRMPEITEPYIREQLELRRQELSQAVAVGSPVGSCNVLLEEVNAAIVRIDKGTYGICETCQGTIEKERLIADPLVKLCLDHMTSEEHRALERDLELAGRVQRGLLPQPDIHHLDWHVHYQYQPAGPVSGDYCDVIPPQNGNGKLTFLLGDVAGKGVAASLLMTHLHAMFRSLSGLGLDLAKLIETANRVFCESTFAGQYATLVCGQAAQDGAVEITSAGHYPALHISKSGIKEVCSNGVPLGMFSKSTYAVCQVTLAPSDTLLLYTDGILEATGPDGKEFGAEQISRLAAERHGWPPRRLLGSFLDDVRAFSRVAHPADDQTLMAIRRS